MIFTGVSQEFPANFCFEQICKPVFKTMSCAANIGQFAPKSCVVLGRGNTKDVAFEAFWNALVHYTRSRHRNCALSKGGVTQIAA